MLSLIFCVLVLNLSLSSSLYPGRPVLWLVEQIEPISYRVACLAILATH